MLTADLERLLGIPFSVEQLAAITAPLRPGLIVAGAGSGKTTVMAARVVWLVGTGQVEVEAVLGLTFTNKAAGELESRMRTALAALGGDGPGAPTVSTYHAFAGTLLTDHGLRLGYEPGSRLLADATRFQLVERAVRGYRRPVRHLLGGLPGIVARVAALDAELSEHAVAPEQAEEFERRWQRELEAAGRSAPGAPMPERIETALRVSQRRQELLGFVAGFRELKRAYRVVDFGDQVRMAAELAGLAAVAADQRARWRVVLLDEYQDTSVAQRRMLQGLFGDGHPVTAVGDPCQSIYGFRGASVANLSDFPVHFPGGARFELTVNRRSGGRLLAVANDQSAGLRARHEVAPLAPDPARADLGVVEVSLHETVGDELRALGQRLAEVIATGTAPGEVAVLVRNRSQFAGVLAALGAAGVPAQVVGLGGLLSVPAVADIVAWLQLLAEPTANAATVRLLTGPQFRLGLRDLHVLGRRATALVGGARNADRNAPSPDPGAATDELLEELDGQDPSDLVSLADAAADPGRGPYGPGALERLQAFTHLLTSLRRQAGGPLLDLVSAVLALTGLEGELAVGPEPAAEAVASFVGTVARFTDLDGTGSLAALLGFLAASDEFDDGLDRAAPVSAQAVSVLTAHRAKGLEWDVVALPGVVSKAFPSERNTSVWTTQDGILPGPVRGDYPTQPQIGGASVADLAAHKEASNEHLQVEEARLAYVALTRARHLVLVSGHHWGPTQVRPRGPSPLLAALHRLGVAGMAGVTVAHWRAEPELRSNPAAGGGAAGPGFLGGPLGPEHERRRAQAGQVRARRGRAVAPWEDPEAPDAFAELDHDLRILLAEERRRRVPADEVVLPRTLSASQVLALAADPERLAAQLLRPTPQRPVAAARRGTSLHEWIQGHYQRAALLDPEQVPGASDPVPDVLAISELRERFLATSWAARTPLALEAPFSLVLGDHVIRGRIDAVFPAAGPAPGVEVVDWKTGGRPGDRLQLALYRLAWHERTGTPLAEIRAAFVSLASGRTEWAEQLPGRDELEALVLAASAAGR